MRIRRSVAVAIGAFTVCMAAAPTAGAAKPAVPDDALVVCKHGCDFRTIQDAVEKSRKGDTIAIEPGVYREGVLVKGHKHDDLTITGVGKKPKQVVLEGKRAKAPDGQPANNGIEGTKVDGLRVMNLTVRNFLANGVFVNQCSDYLMKDIFASYNRAYGLYAFDCIGGRMTRSTGVGHGDSAFYVGATPEQAKPKWTSLDHLDGHGNVQGWTGTNSRYIKITKGNFYNNGLGLVPNTLDSEPYEPSTTGIITKNNVFWNNFNYFAAGSPVSTVSDGLGEIEGLGTINFPTGVGIINLGVTGWKVTDNNVFGNFKWGIAMVSNPFNEGGQAITVDNEVTGNRLGRDGSDPNGVDLFSTGSGSGNCYADNGPVTMDASASASNDFLYPSCPAPAPPASGTGDSTGDGEQFGDLAGYVTSSPSEQQECAWAKHPHPPFKKYEPFEVAGVSCP